MNTHSKQILIIAGEASGDLLGAHLAKSLKFLDPQLKVAGMGGKRMREAGVNIFIEAEKLAVVGVSEIISQLGDILAARQCLKNHFKIERPDLVIFIDYPGFNLHMAKQAKKAGIKVLYYVSPQIWAWRYGRIKKIKKYVDHMGVLFPFEERLYQRENISVSLVGHPLIDITVPTLPREKVYQKFDLSTEKPIIGLFPGSRSREIARLLPIITSATRLIKERLPNAQFVLPLAPNLSSQDVHNYLFSDIKIIEDNTYNVLSVCDAAIAVSGTVTLEIALHQIPFVILYKVSPLTYWLGKRLIQVPFIGLSNLVAEEPITPEFIQHQATPQAIANEIYRLLEDHSYRQTCLNKLKPLRAKLGDSGASLKTAKIALKLITS
ncbi:lipid-A-disaccharide synthase [Candidatus Coxiella mudrowiae]|uniref:Lipid-A-disaccharide synthase n=1 Tax=Candidatus Coxiella mudrowiae TaxID=2054173 RepID=A0ABM5UTU4_9COXI|nr:lipid-A-disaccharide synthase [Candidatus Coxiella mudrowiae]AKQ33376.1 Lipid-A-disaccharide synthase [Candidatus Coxiella mudrowiae]AKQ33463.1 Lipid-A-disaccharide synthase [Candidatus Coxiella mudrowiae]